MTVVHGLIGPPGTGKTTSVAQRVRAANQTHGQGDGFKRSVRTPALICSLTRAAAAEAAGRDTGLSRRSIGTIHSHAFQALGCSGEVIAEASVGSWNESRMGRHYPITGQKSSKKSLEDLHGEVGGMPSLGDRALDCLNFSRALMIPKEERPKFAAEKMASSSVVMRSMDADEFEHFEESWEVWKREENLYDFTDLLEVALAEVDTAPGDPHEIYMDEAQDSSKLALALMRKWGSRCDHLTIVGDPYQSLYGWAGAYPEMFFDGRLADCEVLEQSYRVPRAVHRAAVSWIEQKYPGYIPVEYRPRDEDGVAGIAPFDHRNENEIARFVEKELEAGRSVMLQAPTTKTVSYICRALRSAAVPFSNPWRRHNGAWNPIQSRRGATMPRDRVVSLVNFHPQYRTWQMQDVAKFVEPLRSDVALVRGGKKLVNMLALEQPERWLETELLQQIFSWEAITLMFRPLLENADPASALKWWFNNLLQKRQGSLRYPVEVYLRRGMETLQAEPTCYVGTIHSFKGSEADTTVIFPDLSIPWVRAWNESAGSEYAGLVRMGYVALTRARHGAYIAQPYRPSMAFPLWEFV